MKGFVITLLRFYQAALSPYLGSRCRFMPSCSHYAIAAVQDEGAFHGTLTAIRRLLRCHPFCRGGFDPYNSGTL